MIKHQSDKKSEQRPAMHGGAGIVTLVFQVNREEVTQKCRLCADLIIPPGAGIGEHEHLKEDEIYIVRQGSGLLNDNGSEKKVTAGDVIVTGNGAKHAIHNNGTTDLIITAVIVQY